MKTRLPILGSSALSVGLSFIASTAGAQNLYWSEVPGNGCASSISVAPNNVPLITGCGGTADHGIYYLGTGTCSPSPCFPPPQWNEFPGNLQAARVFETVNGQPFALTSNARVYVAIHQDDNTNSYGQASGWAELIPSNPTCMSWLAPGQSSDALEVDVTPGAIGNINNYIWGIGCQTPNASVYQWNVRLGAQLYDPAPGWLQLDTQDNAAGTQIVLFTGPGPTNPQVLWMKDALGAVYSYNGEKFTQEPAPLRPFKNHLIGAEVVWLTDHYAIDNGGAVVSWNDNTNSWSTVIGTKTPIGTYITQIAAAPAFQTTALGAVGPSSVWGVDNDGNVFQLKSPGTSQ